MQTRPIDQSEVSIRRVHAVINPASGGVAPRMAEALAALFSDFGLDHQISELLPGHLEATVRAAVDAGPDLIVVLGGDGTARLVAEMCGPQGPLVAPLPAGTMSKLGHAIYGPGPWREALSAALERGAARWAPGGEVGGRAFYCSALLGPPARWARAREAIRARNLRRAWRRAVVAYHNAFLAGLHYEFDGEIDRGLAIRLICPTVSRALRQDERALEAAVLDLRDTKAGLRLALHNLFGDWRDDPGVTVRPCVSGRVWAKSAIPAMLDGEFFRVPREVEIRFRARAFRALAPGKAGPNRAG